MKLYDGSRLHVRVETVIDDQHYVILEDSGLRDEPMPSIWIAAYDELHEAEKHAAALLAFIRGWAP